MITKHNQSVTFIFVCFFLFLFYSCGPTRLVGSWEFIEIYDGVLTKIDTLKDKKNKSRYGTGTLTFRKDGFFTSMETEGNYQKKGKILKMKYPDPDTVVMNISYLNKNYLLLSTGKNSKTWFYRKK